LDDLVVDKSEIGLEIPIKKEIFSGRLLQDWRLDWIGFSTEGKSGQEMIERMRLNDL